MVLNFPEKINEMLYIQKPVYALFIHTHWPCPQDQKSAMAIQNSNKSGDERINPTETQGKHFKRLSAHKIEERRRFCMQLPLQP